MIVSARAEIMLAKASNASVTDLSTEFLIEGVVVGAIFVLLPPLNQVGATMDAQNTLEGLRGRHHVPWFLRSFHRSASAKRQCRSNFFFPEEQQISKPVAASLWAWFEAILKGPERPYLKSTDPYSKYTLQRAARFSAALDEPNQRRLKGNFPGR